MAWLGEGPADSIPGAQEGANGGSLDPQPRGRRLGQPRHAHAEDSVTHARGPPTPKTGTNRMEVCRFTGHRTFTLLNTLAAWPARAPGDFWLPGSSPPVLAPLG